MQHDIKGSWSDLKIYVLKSRVSTRDYNICILISTTNNVYWFLLITLTLHAEISQQV